MTPKELKEYYSSIEFKTAYHYDGELGVTLTEEGTEFRLWSPLSKSVTLRLYQSGEGETLLSMRKMKKVEKGVWFYQTNENLAGTYYDFQISSELRKTSCVDPYAKAVGMNGKRSMVVDLKATNPPDFEKDKAPEKGAEDIIYELHVKEFSHAVSGGFCEENRGKYKAFTENSTSLRKEGRLSTGLSYIKNLGATYIELLPVFDYASVDEKDENAFNWGYDPLNYNVPEGSYSSNPSDGAVRIREFKEMVQAIHKEGMRVIMDVVYNHTYSLDTCFQKTVPWYFYRVDDIGQASDGSACGNDFAAEMAMAGKYILDSVLYWAKEYHIDGFRFDLMGLIPVKLMNKIRKELDKEFGEGEKIIFGEPWSADTTFVEDEQPLATKKNLYLLSDGIGIFSDDIRDGIKGSVFYEELAGFVNGNLDFTENIVAAVTAFRGEEEGKKIRNATTQNMMTTLPYPKSPNQIINYISCHDNQTLWDKLAATTKDEELRRKQNRLAASIYLMCQGRCFIYSGEEFLRTKNGEHNTYNASAELNKMDWNLIEENKDMVDFYRGLIALRKEFTGLSDKGERAYANIRFLKVRDGLVVFAVKNEPRGKFSPKWKEAVIVWNARAEEKEIYLPDGDYLVLSDGVDSLLWEKGEARPVSKEVTVPPQTAMIFGLQKSW